MNIRLALFSSFALLTIVASDISIKIEAAESDYHFLPTQSETNIADDVYLDSLARLPQVQRDGLDATGRNAFDTYVSPGTGYETGLRGPVGVWMNSPVLAEAVFDVRQRVRYESGKDQRLTELAIISTAREINNQYEYSAHEPLAQTAGLEAAIIDVVRFRKSLDDLPAIDGLGDAEKTIIRFAREVISEEKVRSETFASALEIFGPEGVTDLTGLIGYYSFVAITLKAFDVQRPIGTELLLPVLD